jgi:hypothetical protein
MSRMMFALTVEDRHYNHPYTERAEIALGAKR